MSIDRATVDRYTVRDVNESDALCEYAYEYVENYGGTFEYLVDARARFARDGMLPAPILKGVLNCALADGRAPALPVLPRGEALPRRKLRVVPDPPTRPKLVEVTSAWKMKYFYPTYQRAQVVHLLDTLGGGLYANKGKVLLFNTTTGTFLPAPGAIRGLCGATLATGKMSNEMPPLRQCTRCLDENEGRWR